VWIKFTPKDGERSTGDIVSIESPSLSSPIFSAWVGFPEQAIHYSFAQEDIDISRSVRTGVKIPKTAFHLAIVYDCSTFTFYINGEKRKTIPESSPLPDPQSVCVKFNESNLTYGCILQKLVVLGRSENQSYRGSHCTRQIFSINIYPQSLEEVRNFRSVILHCPLLMLLILSVTLRIYSWLVRLFAKL
jgi:hypothetical protein